MTEEPDIVCLCGSTRFKKEYEDAAKKFTLEGKIVLSVGMFGHQEGLDMDGPIKRKLDELHLRKIDKANWIFVINPKVLVCKICCKPTELYHHSGFLVSLCCHDQTECRPYIGESTRREITYARQHGKSVVYLEEPGQ